MTGFAQPLRLRRPAGPFQRFRGLVGKNHGQVQTGQEDNQPNQYPAEGECAEKQGDGCQDHHHRAKTLGEAVRFGIIIQHIQLQLDGCAARSLGKDLRPVRKISAPAIGPDLARRAPATRPYTTPGT